MSLYTRGKRSRGCLKKIFINKLIKKNFNPNQFLKASKIFIFTRNNFKKNRSFNFGFQKFRTLYLTGLSSFL